jgi:hypothetical protein
MGACFCAAPRGLIGPPYRAAVIAAGSEWDSFLTAGAQPGAFTCGGWFQPVLMQVSGDEVAAGPSGHSCSPKRTVYSGG